MSNVNNPLPSVAANATVSSGSGPTTPTQQPQPQRTLHAMATAATTNGAGTAPALVKGANSKAALKAWLDKCKELGERSGSGTASELEWKEDMVERAFRGEIDPDDAAEGFTTWREARDAKLGPAKSKALTKSSRDKLISEAKTILTWGMLPNANAPRVFGTVIRVVNATASLRGEIDEKLLKVARTQIKAPDSPLTEAEIKHLLTQQQEKADPTEVGELDKVRKALNKIGETFNFNAHTRAALTSITARIDQLGGTTAEKRAAEKARKAAEKKAAKAKARK